MKSVKFSQYLLILLLNQFILGLTTSFADEDKVSASPAPFNISIDNLQTKIDALASNSLLSEKEKTLLSKLYKQADENIRDLEWYSFLNSTFQNALANGKSEIHKTESALDRLTVQIKLKKHENLKPFGIEALETKLAKAKFDLESIETEINKLETRIEDQKLRPDEIRNETQSALNHLADAQEQYQKLPHQNQSSFLQEAEWFSIHTKIDAESMHLTMLKSEIDSYPLRIELLKTQKQLENLKKKPLIATIKAIETRLTMLKKQQHEAALEALLVKEMETAIEHRSIRQITRENYDYNKQLQNTSESTRYYQLAKDKIEAMDDAIEKDYKSAEKKIDLAGISPVLGRLLREQRRNLSQTEQTRNASLKTHEKIKRVSLELFKLEERNKQLFDLESIIQQLLELDSPRDLTDSQTNEIIAEIENLLSDQKDLINRLISENGHLLRLLGDYDFSLSQYHLHVDRYTQYLDQRLLWVRSAEPLNMGSLYRLMESIYWFFSPNNWQTISSDFLNSLNRHPYYSLFGIFVLVLFLIIRRRIVSSRSEISTKVDKLYSDNFRFTLITIFYDLILSLPVAVLTACIGWLIRADEPQGTFSFAVGSGMIEIALPLFFLKFFCLLFATKGIFTIHFHWPLPAVNLVRHQIYLIRLIAIPALFLIYMTGDFVHNIYSETLGRSALICTFIIMTIAIARIFSPNQGLLHFFNHFMQQSWLYKTRYFWFPAIVSIPLIVAIFAILGYYLSALELQQKLIYSLRFFLITVFIHQLIIRWLNLINRKLALQNARIKRKSSETSGDTTSNPDELPIIEEELIDIPKINTQTIQFINVMMIFVFIAGISIIWKNIFPAFSFMKDIVLWQHIVQIEGQQQLQKTTLLNVGFAALYLFLAIILIKNLSGVMEIFIFRHFSMQHGSRYATTQITQYALITFIFVSIASELGGSWNQVQWLVAALGVGLGFGLQEIFANLVSGIILLFERPIRIGDTVTIGETTGTVNRIQMRATTIIDWDQKELVVPNKTFITDRLVNWSLTNPITRIVVPVGLAYGTDVSKAREILLDTVKKTENVLTDPEPLVFFLGFGDSSLDFSIRVFVPELSYRLQVMHDLHININRALQQHQIEIPFPQRDIHIRS